MSLAGLIVRIAVQLRAAPDIGFLNRSVPPKSGTYCRPDKILNPATHTEGEQLKFCDFQEGRVAQAGLETVNYLFDFMK